MNQKKAKWINKMIATRNPVLLLLIRNEFGEATQGMTYSILKNKAKKLYKMGKFKNITGWPTRDELRKMKPRVIGDELIASARANRSSS